MNHAIKMTALAVFAATFGATAIADDKASTTGGFKIKSEDGNFEAKIGGRIHFDANYYINEDDLNAGAQNSKNDFFFRRARLSLEGRAYDFTYKFENDFASSGGGKASTTNEGLREMWIGTKVLGDANLRLGQAKPYRGMEELTSSNELLFMERSFTTANGIYGKQFVQGVFIDGSGEGYGWGVSAYSPHSAGDLNTAGSGFNARGFVTPIRSNGALVHIGVSGSVDKYDTASTKVQPRIVGREGGLRETVSSFSANDQSTYALELAGRVDGLYFAGEYAKAKFEKLSTSATQDVDALSLQASFFVTNHSKPYDFKKGVFKSPKVDGQEGAIELKARYDMIENKDDKSQEASYYGLGVNYYATPNTRFMLEYIDGKFDSTVVANNKSASAITARAQFNF